jgi:hypothetical protein
MAKDNRVRVLIGSRKGTYVVESDRSRRKWKVGAPAHAGNDVFHVAADPRHPGELYSAVNNSFWGPEVQKSKNWGKTWKEIATPLTPIKKDRPDPFSTPADAPPKPVANLWHIEPGHADEPDVVYLGAEPHLLFRSGDRGASWEPVDSINHHPGRKDWSPGGGGANLHTIIVDPRDPNRLYVGMSAVGTFRSEDGGKSWTPTNKGVKTPFLPGEPPEIGQCVHHVAMDGADPDTFYRQDHAGMYVSHDRMSKWVHIGGPVGDDFGFCVSSPRASPGRAYFVPLISSGGMPRVTAGHFQVIEWNDASKKWRKLVKPGAFPGDFGVQREGIATDDLDPAGIYVGTTTGHLFVSPNAGKSWQLVPFAFPGIHSVTVASPT